MIKSFLILLVGLSIVELTSLQIAMGQSSESKTVGEATKEIPTEAPPEIPKEPTEECPENSRCNVKGAEAYKAWSETLKNKHLTTLQILNALEKKWGTPVNFWSTKKEINKDGPAVLTWDSSCPAHQLPGKEIGQSTLFLKDFSEKKLKDLEAQGYFTDFAVIKVGKDKFQTLKVPRGDTPLYLEKKGGPFISDIEGTYFYFHLAGEGIKVSADDKKIKDISRATSIHCPNDLQKFMEEHLPKNEIFAGFYCKSIWDSDANQFRDVIFTKGCP